MTAAIVFAVAIVFIVSVLLALWADAEEWYHHHDHELLLDELWDDEAEEAA